MSVNVDISTESLDDDDDDKMIYKMNKVTGVSFTERYIYYIDHVSPSLRIRHVLHRTRSNKWTHKLSIQ